MSSYFKIYDEQNKSFLKLKLSDSLASFKGFIAASIAQGCKSDDKKLLSNIKAYLNNDENLAGSLIALIVSDAVSFENAYKSKTLNTMFLQGDDGFVTCLEYFKDFCYGVTQSLIAENSFKNNDFILDFTETCARISEMDENSEFSDEFYLELLDYVVSSLMTIYSDFNK